jgi:2-polyprenyl-3-methyl-5-hydroxy-6-metoxy-1,4-benzoquinol methylase
MTAPTTAANADVLAFYRALPFNERETVAAHAERIRRDDLAASYPPLPPLLAQGTRVVEVGCGVGALALSIAHFHRAQVTAIDFNPVAIERARSIADHMQLPVDFVCADLFQYEPTCPAAVVVSLGVLHHTNDCLSGVRRCIEHFTEPGGHLLVGLYHAFGRRPFLEHFRALARDGASEEAMLAEYARLHSWLTDRTHLYSWFRDQVLHPHETQHTLREIVDVAETAGADVVATSINRFAPVDDVRALYDHEREYEALAQQRLREGKYFPGFFVTLLRKRL